MIVEQLLRIVAGLLVGIWVARYLGPTHFGIFSYSIAFAALFSGVARLGLDSIVVRDLVSHPDRTDFYLGTAFWLKLTGSFLMLITVGCCVQFTNSDSSTKLYVFIIAASYVFQAFDVVDFYFQSRVLSKLTSICRVTQLIFSSSLKLYLVFVEAELLWFVFVILIDELILSIALYFAYRRQRIKSFLTYFDYNVALKLLSNSWPLILSGLVIMVYMRIDQIMIKEILGEKEVGIYSAAIRLSEVWYFVPVLVTNSLYPSLINARKINEELYLSRFRKLLTFLIWTNILVATLTTLLSQWIVASLYGNAYQEAGQILMIHTWGGVFVAIGVASGAWFVIENIPLYSFYRTGTGAFLNIFLNFALIPTYGIFGAAIATVISQSMAALFFDLLTKKTRPIFLVKIKALFFPNLR